MSKKKLKMISDEVFQEVPLLEDNKQSLRWKKDFNFVKLLLKNINIRNIFRIHDDDIVCDENKDINLTKKIKSNINSNIIIESILDEYQISNNLYFAIKENNDNDIYRIEAHNGSTIINIKSSNAIEEGKGIYSGLYYGDVFKSNSDTHEDDLYFVLSMPEEQFNVLVELLKEDKYLDLEVSVYLLSHTLDYGFIKDDTDILIKDGNPCYISNIMVTSSIKKNELLPNIDYNKEEKQHEFRHDYYEEILKIIFSYSKLLTNLVRAIWILIFAIILNTILDKF